MKRLILPAANALARADGLGLRRYAIEKKSPRKGTKTFLVSITYYSKAKSLKKSPRERGRKPIPCINSYILFHEIEKKSPRKGTKTPMCVSLC